VSAGTAVEERSSTGVTLRPYQDEALEASEKAEERGARRQLCTWSVAGSRRTLLGISRQRVDQIAKADPTFPEPVAILSGIRVWETADIEAWAREKGRIR